ncbi:MAG: RHS repeat domain-containing protein, partial [Longimicrobiales bacterium]
SIKTAYDALGRDTLRSIGQIRIDAGETAYYGNSIGTVAIAADAVHTSYDPMGRILVNENLAGSRIDRAWNKEGTLQSERQMLKEGFFGEVVDFTYVYNRANQRVSFSNNRHGRTITYGHGAGGVLNAITISGLGTVALRHDVLGRRDSVAYPNGTLAKYRFDADGRVRDIDVTRSGSTQLALRYSSYDPLGRVLSLTKTGSRTLPDAAHTFTWAYRKRGFLRFHSEPNGSHHYKYDASGNLIETSDPGILSTFTIPAGTNRLASRTRGSQSYTDTYDLNGNLTLETNNLRYYHDPLNRLVKTQLPDAPVLFEYDGLGRTVKRPVPSPGSAWQMYDGTNVVMHNDIEFVHGPGTDDPLVALAPPGQGICGTSAAYFVTLGNRLLDFQDANGLDCTGVTGWTQFGAFAGAIQSSYSYNLSSSSEQETKTSHFRNRHYSAEHGRFLQEDPIGFAGGLNLYAYAGNDPATFTDPFGLNPCRGAAALGASLGAAAADGPIPIGDIAAVACLTAAATAKFGPSIGKSLDRARTAVYSAVENGRTIYVGITNNLAARAAAHFAQKSIRIRALPGLSDLPRADARAVEQVMIEFHRLGKSGGTLINRINSIAQSNPAYADALNRGRELLLRAGYEGFK